MITSNSKLCAVLPGRLVWLVALLVLSTGTASEAQQPVEPFAITDNSFLVEEAFNQEPRVFQNIATWIRTEHGGWDFGFTQEWPLFTQRHQLSYTLGAIGKDGQSSYGPTFIHYRFQALQESASRPAFSPRFSLVLPTGPRESVKDGVGAQVNLPLSKQIHDLYFHGNAGVTWLPRRAAETADSVILTSPHLGGSAIWRLRPMINLMLETTWIYAEFLDDIGASERIGAFTLSPGVRGGWNIGDQQLVVGVATPMTRADGETIWSLLTYVSYERPF